MYIRPQKKRRNSPVRVAILLALIGAGVYFLVFRRDDIEPIQIGPTPTATPTAREILAEAEALYLEGDMDGALAKYGEAAALDPEDPDPLIWQSLLLTLRQFPEEAV